MANIPYIAPDWIQEVVQDFVSKREMPYLELSIFVKEKLKVSNGMPVKCEVISINAQRSKDVKPNVILTFNEQVFSMLDEDSQNMVLSRVFAGVDFDEEGFAVKRSADFCEHTDLINLLNEKGGGDKTFGYRMVEQNRLAVESVVQELKELEEEQKAAKKATKRVKK